MGEYLPHIFIDGVRTPADKPIKDHFPTVVSGDEFYLANAAREARRVGKVTKTTEKFSVCAGILHCFRCGEMMHLQGQRQRKC